MLAPKSSEPKPKRPKHDNGKSTTQPKIEGFIAQLANASGPTVRARLGPKGPIATKALLDTGNLYRPAISEDLFLKLPKEYRKLRPLKATCPTANVADVGMKVLGELEKAIPLKLGNCKFKFELTPVVLQGLSHPFNIGWDYMRENCIDPIPSENVVKIKGRPYSLFPEEGEVKFGVHLMRAVTVPPMSETYAWAQLSKDPKTRKPRKDLISTMRRNGCLLSGATKFQHDHNLSAWSEVVHRPNEKGQFRIGLINTTPEPIKVKADALYGHAEPMLDSTTKGSLCLVQPPEHGGFHHTTPDGKSADSQCTQDPPDPKEPEWMVGPTTTANRERRVKFLCTKMRLDECDALKTPTDRVQAISLVLKYWSVFSWDGLISKTDLVTHTINLYPGASVARVRHRIINPVMEESLFEQLKEWQKNDIIEKSTSEWNAPLVPVQKPSGKIRWCVDYRLLNDRTVKDTHPIGSCLDSLSRLSRSRVYSVIDGEGAFHSLPIDPKSRHLTAFSSPFGVFQFRYMPFGLVNAPASYARLVRRVLDGISWRIALPYLDDTLIHSQSLEEHFDHLEMVLQAFAKANMKLGPTKCHLFRTRVKFLGHRISKEGVSVDERYVQVVKDWPLPNTRHKVRVFYGKVSYYKRFIRNFQQIAKPLSDQLRKSDVPDNKEFVPTTEFEASFNHLKTALTNAPILAFPSFSSQEPFILDTDWSKEAGTVGAVLSQRQDGIERPILYGSIKLSKSQRNYSATKGELAAIIIFLKSFKYYLQLRPFVIRTDHSALTSIKTMDHPSGMIQRWLEALSNYQFTVEHRAGTKHSNADALSRVDHAPEDPALTDIGDNNEESIMTLDRPEEKETRIVRTLDESILAGLLALNLSSSLSATDDWVEEQRNDLNLGLIHRLIDNNEKPTPEMFKVASKEGQLFLSNFSDYFRDGNGLLRWNRPTTSDQPNKRQSKPILIPRSLRQQLCKTVHEESGHRGRDETVRRCIEHFYWPSMAKTAASVRNSCTTCEERGPSPNPQKGLLMPAIAAYPFQRVCVDFVGPWPVAKGGYRYILTVLDTFSRWLEAFPTKTASAAEVTQILVKEIFTRFGLPERIHSDRGTHFTAESVQELANELKIVWELGPAYSPKSNNVESHHRTLNGMITKLQSTPGGWLEVLPVCLFLHRTSVCRSTGLAPYSLLFGREPSTPLDLLFKDPHEALQKQADPSSVREQIQKAAQYARDHLSRTVARSRLGYKGLKQRYAPESKVWLFTPRIKPGNSKKTTTFWSGPWTVIKEINPLVYEIAPHPVWVRKKNEIVTIDRLKPYRSHESDDEGQLSVAPPSDTDLAAAGNEFMERFTVSETQSQEDDDTVPNIPLANTPTPIQEQPAPAPPPIPQPAPADEVDDPVVDTPEQPVHRAEENVNQHYQDNGGVVVVPVPRPQPGNRTDRLLEEARRFMGPDLPERRARNEQQPVRAQDSNSETSSDSEDYESSSDPEFIAYLRALSLEN